MSSTEPRHAQVIGTGLIGGSIGMALRLAGWRVTGMDRDPQVADRARERGAIDEVAIDGSAELCVVALPVGSIVDAAREMLDRSDWVVTDVGSVKGPIVAGVDSPRFVGGHPMAGSEQDGIAGSTGTMFQGAAWVVTPTETTDPTAHALVHTLAVSCGADVVTMSADDHDRVVAMVSHVPHLTAVTLMGMAATRANEHAALLRLAAGGFRDMTRIAAGHPGIWPDICAENRDAIVDVLDDIVAELQAVRSVVAGGDRAALLERLTLARTARLNLPTTAGPPEALTEIRVGVSDRPGVLAEIATLATATSTNIYDLEIAHSAEGAQGVLILLVDAAAAAGFVDAIVGRGYRCSARDLT